MSPGRQHTGPGAKIGYVLKRFPRLSETFVLNELLELRRQGMKVEIFSLLKPPAEARHELLETLDAEIVYLPDRKLLHSCTMNTGQAAAPTRKLALDQLLAGRPPMTALLPGKGADEAAHLGLQAAMLALLASARGIEHLHAHFATNATTVALLASRWSGIPFSFTAHARDIYHSYTSPAADAALRRRKIAEARFVITVSDYNRRHLRELAGEPHADKILRLYNGIDLSRFAPSGEEPITGPDAPATFLAVGRLIEKKGFGDLIAACRILHEQDIACRCLIVGDGPDRDALQAQIRSAGLETRIELLGALPQETVIAAMRRATALVLPSVVSASGDRDGLPTVLLEALAIGLPAISTTVAGIPEIIDDERTGLLVPPGNPVKLARAMRQLSGDPSLRRRLRREGRIKAEREFDLRRNVALLRAHLDGAANDESRLPAGKIA